MDGKTKGNEMTTMTEMYGEVISSYSRAQAIDDGVLIDVSDNEACLFKHPIAITNALHLALLRGEGNEARTYNARLRDVFCIMTLAARRGGPDVFFTVKVGARNLNLWGNCGPGDDPAPVITVGLPSDR